MTAQQRSQSSTMKSASEDQHSLPSYPPELRGCTTLQTTTSGDDEDVTGPSGLKKLEDSNVSILNGRFIRLAHTALTIVLAVMLAAVLLQKTINHRHETNNAVMVGSSGGTDRFAGGPPTTATGSPSPASSSSSSASWIPLPSKDSALDSVAFGSCMKEDMPQPFWDTVVKMEPDVTLLGGDNVYRWHKDCQDSECTDLKGAYEKLDSNPSFIGAKRVLPMVAQLDDHDYGQNDCDHSNPYKEVAKEIFLDWLDEPQDSPRRREGEGLYTYYEWGPMGKRVQLILLDTRYSRSEFLWDDELDGYVPDHDDKSKRVLSHVQWQWLENEVLSQPANVRLILSTVQVMSEGEWGYEGWDKIPHELHKLKQMLSDYCMGNVTQPSLPVLLSGDRHMGAFYYDEDFDLYEVTASSWTHTIPEGFYGEGGECEGVQCVEPDQRRVDHQDEENDYGIVWVNHFGLVTFDWEQRTVDVSLVRAESSQNYPYIMRWEENTDAGEVLKSFTLDIP